MSERRNFPYSMQEREISLTDLLWNILYAWRAIILFGILSACLLAGVKYIKDKHNSASGQGVSVESIKAQLSEEDNLKLERAIVENKSIERQLAANAEYQKNSILMNLDPYNESQVVLQYYVNTHYTINLNENIVQDYAQELRTFYMTYVTNDKVIEECAQKLDVEDAKYLRELIRAEEYSSSDNDVFCVFVTGKDMGQANEIADIVQGALEKYQGTLSSKIGAHDLVLVNYYEQVVQDSDLALKQAQMETSISTLRTQQSNLKLTLSSQQLQLLEAAGTEDGSTLENSEAISPAAIGISKKYAILGLLAGIFFVCAAIALKYILDRHIKDEKELQEYFGLRIFGTLDNPKRTKKIFSVMDEWMYKVRGKEKGTLDEQMELTVTNLIVTCRKFEIDKVLFTTSVHFKEEERQLLRQIMGQMKEQGIESVFEENMMRNAKAFKDMSEIGQVVFVEKKKHTEYAALEQEMILCEEQEAEVVGVIAFEA